MLDVNQTRARFINWIKSPAFDARFDAGFRKKRWPYTAALVLLAVAFAIGRLTGNIDALFVLVVIAMMLFLHGYNHGRRRAAARRDAHVALKDHVPVLGVVALGNDSLFGTKGVVAPGLFVGIFDVADEEALDQIIPTTRALTSLYGKDPANEPAELREACLLVNDDTYRPDRRRKVPDGLATGDKLWLFDLLLVSEDLPGPTPGDDPFLVCMASPGPAGSIIHVPAGVAAFVEGTYDPNIIHHKAPATPPPLVAPHSDNLDAVDEHITRHLGEVAKVFHEIVSTTVHIDVHIVPAAPGRPWISLVTSGMSDLPMNAPQGSEDFRFAELMIRLPAGWNLEQSTFDREENYWPIRLLKFLARFPHEYETWLSYGHTVPNGNPPEPLAPDIPFTGVVLGLPGIGGEGFAELRLKDGTPVHFWSLFPLHPSEMEFKLAHGSDALFARFDAAGYDDLFDPARPPLA